MKKEIKFIIKFSGTIIIVFFALLYTTAICLEYGLLSGAGILTVFVGGFGLGGIYAIDICKKELEKK